MTTEILPGDYITPEIIDMQKVMSRVDESKLKRWVYTHKLLEPYNPRFIFLSLDAFINHMSNLRAGQSGLIPNLAYFPSDKEPDPTGDINITLRDANNTTIEAKVDDMAYDNVNAPSRTKRLVETINELNPGQMLYRVHLTNGRKDAPQIRPGPYLDSFCIYRQRIYAHETTMTKILSEIVDSLAPKIPEVAPVRNR